MKPNQIICGNNIEVVKPWASNCVDAIVTDPPYELGFMGKSWDSSGIAYSVPMWKQMLRITKPGGFLLCFGGTRTYHRLTCAIEDAGWEIRDCMMWLYGSGFPKSHDISKAIDKAKGAERKVVGIRKQVIKDWMREMQGRKDRLPDTFNETAPATDLAQLWDGYGTALKPAWEPIIVAMKPLDGTFAHNAEAHGVAGLNIDGGRIPANPGEYDIRHYTNEDCFQNKVPKKSKFQVKPQPSGRWPANLILECICDEVVETDKTVGRESGYDFELGNQNNPARNITNIKSGVHFKDKVRVHTNPDCPCTMLDEQSGTKKSGFMAAGTKRQMSDNPNKNTYGKFNPDTVRNDTYGDRGGASRFFKIIQGDNKCINANTVAQSLSPQKKQGDSAQKHAVTSEAQEGVLSPEESQVIQDSTTNSKECIQPQNPVFGVEEKDNIDTIQITTSPLKSSGSVLPATKQDTPKTKKSEPSRFRYCAKTSRKERNIGLEDLKGKSTHEITGRKQGSAGQMSPYAGVTGNRIVKNTHPTVKPLALMKYLCVLLKMPSAEQVILDPFLGSGTTGMACRELGINFVGIEKEPEYCEIAVRRIAAVEGIHPVVLHTETPPAEVPKSNPNDRRYGTTPITAKMLSDEKHRQSIINAASAALRRNRK